MTFSCGYQTGWRRKCSSLLLVLALLLNLLGPVSGLPQKEGFVPVCTGHEIVYIPLVDLGFDQPAEDRPAPISESCPWFAHFHAVEVVPVTIVYSVTVYKTVQFRPDDRSASGLQIPNTFQARAPPQRGV